MEKWFEETAQRLAGEPLLQGLLAAFCTFILEDPTTLGSGLLVADGKMGFWTAYIGVSLGITVGDLGLYWIGRGIGPKAVEWNWISAERLARANAWFDRNLVLAVIGSRFVPGMRLPTYLGAGIFRASFTKFLLVALGASLVWTLLLLAITIKLGEKVLPLLGDLKWPVAAGFIAVLVVSQWILGRRRARAAEGAGMRDAAGKPIVSPFEFWHPAFFYIPVGIYWLWLAIRHGGLTLPTAANPKIYSGGLIRESKSDILTMAQERSGRWVAPHTKLEKPNEWTAAELVAAAREKLEAAGIAYPFVAKPDIGQRGAGVQLIHREEQLARYLETFPEGEAIVFQELVNHAGEAGILYYRRPGEEAGSIFSITLKYFPSVTGDGARTLRELILADARASIVREVYFRRHAEQLERVLAEGENYALVFAGNHAQGAIFKDGTAHATPELLARIHEIAAGIPEFYFGRFDLRFESLEQLLRGEGFRIVELNGAGAEATHIWDAEAKLGDAYRTLFDQWRILFEIGAENRRRGHAPMPAGQIIRDFLAYRKIVKLYPPAS